jgi:hypothetical protein
MLSPPSFVVVAVVVIVVSHASLQIEKIAYTSGQRSYIDDLRQVQNLTSRVILLYAT